MLAKLKFIIFSILFFASANVLAADKEFTLRLSQNNMTVGENVNLYLDFEDTSDIARPDIELPQGLVLRYRGPSSQISIVNGRTSRSITHSYALIASKEGDYILGPISLAVGADNYISNQAKIKVLSKAQAAKDSRDQLSDRVFVRAFVSKDKVYKSEYFDLVVELLYRDISLHNLQMPKIETSNFNIEDFQQPTQDTVVKNGIRYNRVRFISKAYARSIGEQNLGPVLLQVDMAVQNSRRSFGGFDSMFDDFFSSATLKPLYLTSEDLTVRVQDLPQLNRPEKFSGLIGDFELDVVLDTHSLKAGDPLTMKVVLSGRGPVNIVKEIKPELEERDFKIYEPQVELKDNVKSFEYVIIPKNEGLYTIEEFGLWVFDSSRGNYSYLSKGPFELEIRPAQKQQTQFISAQLQDSSAKKEIDFLEGLKYIKERKQNWMKRQSKLNPYPDVYFYLPILIFAVLFWPFYHKKRMATDQGYAMRRRAPKVAREGLARAEQAIENEDSTAFYEAVYQTLQKYIAYKLNCSLAYVDQNISSKLIDHGYSQEDAHNVKSLFDSCDEARYAASTIKKELMDKDYQSLKSFLFK